MINISINLSKIPKDKIIDGKKGKYVNITVQELQQPDQYGNTHYVAMSQTKEERAAKVEKVYLGNGKEYNFNKPQQSAPPYVPPANPDPLSDLPF